MAVVSDSKTATEMRAEVLDILHKDYERATKDSDRRGKGITLRDISFREGFASALRMQVDFWTHVWVEGKQAPGAKGL